MSASGLSFLSELEAIIDERAASDPGDSYTRCLLDGGSKRAAQKVGEEAVEVALAAVNGEPRELLEETADLLYHLLVLLRTRNLSLADAVAVLKTRHRA